MKHVFLIVAYKNIHLLKDLIQTLSLYNGHVIVHFDAKTLLNIEKEFEEEINAGKVHFLKNNIKVNWGGTSLIRAVFLMIDYALDKFPDEGYYHLLSEQCFPVKSPGYFADFFKRNKGINFIKVFKLPFPNWKSGGFNRINHYHLNDYFNIKSSNAKRTLWFWSNKFINYLQSITAFKRKYPKKFPTLYGGSIWWSLTYECIKYVNDYYKNNDSFRKRFFYTLLPDEILVQTILMDGPFAEKFRSDDNLRYIDWRRIKVKGVGILNIEDHWEEIQKPNYLFARKLNSSDNTFVEKLKKEIIYSTGAEKIKGNSYS